jgi:hypothetical protein
VALAPASTATLGVVRHEPIHKQGCRLACTLEEHYAYFAVPTNTAPCPPYAITLRSVAI